jgi:hypothetical protein
MLKPMLGNVHVQNSFPSYSGPSADTRVCESLLSDDNQKIIESAAMISKWMDKSVVLPGDEGPLCAVPCRKIYYIQSPLRVDNGLPMKKSERPFFQISLAATLTAI